MVFSYKKLKGRIIEKYDSVKAFAEALGVAPSGLYGYLKSGKALPGEVIYKALILLDIPEEEIGIYFFMLA